MPKIIKIVAVGFRDIYERSHSIIYDLIICYIFRMLELGTEQKMSKC